MIAVDPTKLEAPRAHHGGAATPLRVVESREALLTGAARAHALNANELELQERVVRCEPSNAAQAPLERGREPQAMEGVRLEEFRR